MYTRNVYLSIFVKLTIFSCFFLGVSVQSFGQSQPDSIWSFLKIRTDANADDTLDYQGQKVTVTGIASVGTGVLHEEYLQVFIQNDSSGISIFNKSFDKSFNRGDSLVVTGEIERYKGMTEVHVDSYQVFPGTPSDVPAPKPLRKAIYNPQKYLGMLVEGRGKIIEKGNTYNGKYLKLSPSDTAKASIMAYVSNFHHRFQEFDFDVLGIGDEVTVTGVVGEYNPDFPNDRTFKVMLRMPEDLKYASLPRYYWFLGVGGIIVIALLVGGWIVALRRQVHKKTEEIQKSLEEKEVLLREIHHRVKNSLSIVSGLMGLQMDSTEDEEARNVLQDSQSRIQSMALIHEKLYQTETLSDIKLDDYLRELVEAIHGTFSEYSEAVDLKFELETVNLDIDRVVPCGLLINELVVNSFKHAFEKGRNGILEVKLQKKNGMVELTVADNGPGLPEDFDLDGRDSLGSKLISTFASQLEAEKEISEKRDGTAFKFRFSVN